MTGLIPRRSRTTPESRRTPSRLIPWLVAVMGVVAASAAAGLSPEAPLPENADRASSGESHEAAKPLDARLADLYQRLLLLTPPGEQDAILIEMIADPVPVVVIAGLTLADRAISADRTLSEEVVEAALSKLAHDEPDIRGAAASLLTRIGSDPARVALRERLRRERDPGVAAILLASVARWPHPDVADAVESWCVWGVDTPEAFNAAYAMHRAGILVEVDALSAVLDAGRKRDLRSAPLNLLRLLVEAGDEDDRRRIRDLLKDDARAVRGRAARALVAAPAATDAILGLARRESELLPVAIDAVERNGISLGRVFALAAIADTSDSVPARVWDRIIMLAGRLDVAGRVQFAVQIAEDDHRAADAAVVLTDLVLQPPSPARERGLVLLARLYITLGRTSDAEEIVAAIDPAHADAITRGRWAYVRAQLSTLNATADVPPADG